MAEEEEERGTESTQPAFPRGRVKSIMKLDNDICKVNAEALYLVNRSAELFLQFLAEESAHVAGERKRKTIKFDHLQVAVKRHQPTSDFLLDSLPELAPPQPASDRPQTDRIRSRLPTKNAFPAGAQRIDRFFNKAANKAPIDTDGGADNS